LVLAHPRLLVAEAVAGRGGGKPRSDRGRSRQAGTFEIRAKEERGLFLASDGAGFITGQVIHGIPLYKPVRARVTRYRHRGARIPTPWTTAELTGPRADAASLQEQLPLERVRQALA
jgi:hypothetical protein